MGKCEKYVPSYGNKMFLVSGMNQKTSRHTVVTYMDKYILKFGGITKVLDFSKKWADLDPLPAKPEIYSLEKQQWMLIDDRSIDNKKIDFGMWPDLFMNESTQVMVAFGGDKYTEHLLYMEDYKKISKKSKNNKKLFKVSM